MSKELDPELLCMWCMHPLPNKGAVCPVCSFQLSKYERKPHHLPPYTILKGRYLIGSAIGEGGFDITYNACDLETNEHVAIKELYMINVVTREGTQVLPVDNSDEVRQYYRECRKKFLQEAEALMALQDKSGVVAIFDFFQANGTAYIVMEYLKGDDLLAYLKKNGGRIPYAEAFYLLRPIMKSMIEVHRAAIIHRDISPDNIRCLDNRRMKLMDFGSARFTTKDSHSKLVMVKAGYAPPEQYAQNYKIGPWMDVYAMSATFYRCIVGKTPKPSTNRTDDSDIEKPTSLGIKIPRSVEKVLLKGMALRQEDRYQDMYEFYTALKKASAGVKGIDPKTGPSDIPGSAVPDDDDGYSELLRELNTQPEESNGKYVALAVGVIIETIIICMLISQYLH